MIKLLLLSQLGVVAAYNKDSIMHLACIINEMRAKHCQLWHQYLKERGKKNNISHEKQEVE